MTRVITMMPVRLAATRLPNKPLLNINGKTLVQRVYENVEKAMKGKTDIAVAAGDQKIVDEVQKFGGTAILTDPALPSGTDRIAAALKVLDPKGEKYDIVVDFQGDNLNVDPSVCIPLVEMVQKTDCDIATCGMVIKNEEDKTNPNVVKIVMGLKEGEKEGRCLYFTRATAPYTRDPEKCKNQDLLRPALRGTGRTASVPAGGGRGRDRNGALLRDHGRIERTEKEAEAGSGGPADPR